MISEKYPDSEFSFIGRDGGDENQAVKTAGYDLYTIRVEGISRRLTLKNVRAAVRAVSAYKASKALIRDIRPDLVIGTGGYVCWPVLRAAIKSHIPTMIHESNAFPGLVTRMLANRCDSVLLGFEEAKNGLKSAKRISVIGNPVRSSFYTTERTEARRILGISPSELLIVSFGGSLGAEKMNEAIIPMMFEYEKRRIRVTHIHSCGRKHYDKIKSRYPTLAKARGSRIVPYIENMPLWLSAADLAITRSGAMTVAELCASRLPAVLIPSPNVTDNHQLRNAEAMQRIGSATILNEETLSTEKLSETVSAFYKNRALLSDMRNKYPKSTAESCRQKFLKEFENIYRF